MRWYRNSRSEYDLLALSTAGRCGSPAPTTSTGSACWPISWNAAQTAETSSGPRSCISSMKMPTPLPTSAASPPTSVSSSTRSISMSPESARPETAGTSMPGLQRSRSLALAGASRWAKALTTPRTWSTSSCCGWPSSRTAVCRALASGRRSDWSGRASSLPVPQLARTAWLRIALSSTVLPTPRRPVSRTLRSGRPRRMRSSTTSNWRRYSSRPASSGGRWPAPGAYGLVIGSTGAAYGSVEANLRISAEPAMPRQKGGDQMTWGSPASDTICLPAADQAFMPPSTFTTS